MTDFFNWYWKCASPEERELFDKMDRFSSLFSDMLFEQNSPTYHLIQCQSKSKDSDTWIEDAMDLPEEIECFSYEQYTVEIDAIEEGAAAFDRLNHKITISPEYTAIDSVLLHEMIHLHESVLNDLPLYFHDTVFWSLYNDLRGKIIGLDDAINQHGHILNEWSIYRYGGLHDILFLLKSFDLDLKMGYPLGTVLGYDGVNEFSFLTKAES